MTSATRDSQDLWILDMGRESLSRFTFDGSNSDPIWTPDGGRLFYRTTEGLKYVAVDTSHGFQTSRPVLVEAGGIGAPRNRTYSFAPDGERLLALRPHVDDQAQWRVHVILGWADQLVRQ
jgi:hypothetical protein